MSDRSEKESHALYLLERAEEGDPTLSLHSAALPLTCFSLINPKDGFTHLTADPACLLGVANQFYADSSSAWVCVALDPELLGGEVRLETAAPVGDRPPGPAQQQQAPEEGTEGGALLFPHLYGPIPTAAAVREHAVVRAGEGGTAGAFLAIEGLA